VFVTTHALSGVLMGHALNRHPAASFAAGVASHLVLDAMPHWGCDMGLPGGPERFLRAARWDGTLGLAVMATATCCVDRRVRLATVAAMAGAVLLDLDKPMGHFFGVEPFPGAVNRLHKRVQNESPDGLRKEFGYGIALAVVDAVVTVWTRARRVAPTSTTSVDRKNS
jgi:hypothetical protein